MGSFCEKSLSLIGFTILLLMIRTDSKQIKHFYAVETKTNFYKAHIICRANGLELATIESEREEEFLEMHLRQAQIESDMSETFFLNARRQDPESPFLWQTNPQKALNYTKWHKNEPNNLDNIENCLAISRRDDSYGWNDVPCGMMFSYHFICMKYIDDSAEETVGNQTGTDDADDDDYYRDVDDDTDEDLRYYRHRVY